MHFDDNQTSYADSSCCTDRACYIIGRGSRPLESEISVGTRSDWIHRDESTVNIAYYTRVPPAITAYLPISVLIHQTHAATQGNYINRLLLILIIIYM